MERDAALQTGSVDASVTDYMGAMLLHSKGLKVSLPIACQGGFRLVFGRNKELDAISDLRGKHIGLSSNTLIDYATERALVDAKGKPLPYTRVEVQKIPIAWKCFARVSWMPLFSQSPSLRSEHPRGW